MVDPLLAKGGIAVARVAFSELHKRWREFADGNTQRMREAEAIEGRSWRAQRDALVDERLRQLEARATAQGELGAGTAAAVQALFDDHQFGRLEWNYELEGARETTDERRRMLGFAAAWSVEPELSIAQLSRVERTIRELDPEDIDVLKRLADQQAAAPALRRGQPQAIAEPAHREALEKHHENMYVGWLHYRPAGEVLPAAGCVYIAPRATNYSTTTARIEVTDLGKNVLRVLDGYIRSNQPDDTQKEPKP